MRRQVIAIAAVIIASFNPAFAQQREQQVFSPYPQPSFPSVAPQAQAQPVQAAPQNRYMVYPGRERYGDSYGYIPRHPGDYRDAVDRGQWEGGGGASMPRRSFQGY